MSDKRQLPSKIPSETEQFQSALEIDPTEIINLFRTKKLLIIASVLIAMIGMATIMMLTPNRYTSRASILPSGNSSNISGLMGLASNFGLGGSSSGTDENSSALYPSILNSDLVRDGVLGRDYQEVESDVSGSYRLKDYFEVEDPNDLRVALSRQTSISTDKKLGLVRLRVETTNPRLSQMILEEYLAQLEDYLNNKRRSRANENETYLSNQLAIRAQELRESENRLQTFMESNRNWSTSSDPELNMTLARLKREVSLGTETNLLLLQQTELARLEAQKDIPIVRLLDSPSLPTNKSGPARTVNTVFAGLAALLTISIWILLVSFWQQLTGGRTTNDRSQDDQSETPSGNRIRGLLKLNRSSENSQAPVA